MNDTAITDLRKKIPGLDLVTDPILREHYRRDANGFGDATPLAIARPRGIAQLQALVRAAREQQLRLVAVSSSGEHYRGDTTGDDRTIIVALDHLKRILRIDRRNRVALFEAGLTFDALVPAVENHGLRAMLPLCPRPGKSALAAALEREPTIYPRFQWDSADPLLCTELVFGSGEHFRTGAAAGPGSLEQQWAAGDAQKSPLGPGQTDFIRLVQGAQGTLGIVTWCSVKCEPVAAPERLHLASAAQLPPLVRLARMLLRRNHADILFLVSGAALAAILCRDSEGQRLAARHAAPWYLVYSLGTPAHFPEEKLAYVEREIRETMTQTGLSDAWPPAATPEHLLELLTRPDRHGHLPWWKKSGLSSTRELFFQTTLDKAQKFTALIEEEWTGAGGAHEDLLFYVQPQIGGRCCHVEAIFPHAAKDRDAVEARVVRLAALLADRGAFFSRPYGPITDIALARASTAWMIPKVKEIFDPDGILAPGRLAVRATLPQPATF